MTGDEGADDEWDDADTPGSARFRCAWCGKPHERNDPPCENCGHHKFERAVVPVAPDPGEDYEREPVWVCPECGRRHQKNSPPCSRCGNARLERHVPDDAEFADELGGTSYLDLLEPSYAVGLAVALVAAAVLVLALLGVVTLPGMGGPDRTVENVPGSADSANGIDLAEVEAAYLAEITDRRTDAGREALDRSDRLDEVARVATQRRVKAAYGEGQRASGDRLAEAARDACGGGDVALELFRPTVSPGGDGFDSADEVATALVETVLTRDRSPVDFAAENPRTGVDVHAGPDGRVFLGQLVC